MTLYHAILNPSGPNYQGWLDILGSTDVPIKSASPVNAELGTERDVECYLVNVDALTLKQKARLLGMMAAKFDVSIGEVDAEIKRVGFPIRAVDVIVSYDMRAFA